MTRGEIWWADFGVSFGSEPAFNRPVLIIQADSLNKSKLNTVLVIPFTTNVLMGEAPGNIFVAKNDSKLSKDSVLVVSQVSAIDRTRLIKKESKINTRILEKTEQGLRLVFDLG